MINLDKKTAYEISCDIANAVRALRKQHKLTQSQTAKKAGMSLASYKRFEQKGLISLQSLINIAIALGCEEGFPSLFPKAPYASIDEVIRDAR